MEPITNELEFPPRWLEAVLEGEEFLEPLGEETEDGNLGFI
ncbi:MAG TPA: hypothetical protein VGE01_10830 [Fimbriimonas sp.]